MKRKKSYHYEKTKLSGKLSYFLEIFSALKERDNFISLLYYI